MNKSSCKINYVYYINGMIMVPYSLPITSSNEDNMNAFNQC